MKKHVAALSSLLILIFCASCGVDFLSNSPTIDFAYDDYLQYENNFNEYQQGRGNFGNVLYSRKYIIGKEADERKGITHISIKSADHERVLLQFDVEAVSTDPKKYRCFGEDDNGYMFLDIWKPKQGATNMIDGHIASYIIYLNGDDVTYEETPDNAVPLLIKDGWLYAYSKLQFLKIDMETKQQEVLYKLPFEGEFPPYTPRRNDELPEYPDLCGNYEFIISTEQIIFQGDVYNSGKIIDFCTIDIS